MNALKTQNNMACAAIVSKYTSTRSGAAKIVVKSKRGKKIYPYPHELSGENCHRWAVSLYLNDILAQEIKEYGKPAKGWGLISDYSIGTLPSGEYVFVSNI